MGDLPRWASRYQFAEELWRGQNRLVVDPGLERRLRDGALAPGAGADPAVAGLVERLLPTGRSRERVWMGLERGRRAAEYARRHGGVVFGDILDAPEFAADEGWSVAICDLGGLMAEVPRSNEKSVDARLDAPVMALIELLSERAEEGRSVILSAPGRDRAGARGCTLERFVEFIDAHFEGARVFAFADAPMVAAYDLGLGADGEDADGEDDEEDEEDLVTDIVSPRARPMTLEEDYDAELDEAEKTWSEPPTSPDVLAGAGAEEDDDVSLDFDNTLGAAEPLFFSFVAVIGDSDAIGDGVTYVELPSADTLGIELPTREGDSRELGSSAAGLRAQLAEAQRQADLLALERQRLMEQLEDANERLEAFEEEYEEDEDEDDDADDEGSTGARLDAALAEAQRLRWRVRELEGQVEALSGRPIESLEAENAELRAKLEEVAAGATNRVTRALSAGDGSASNGHARQNGKSSMSSVSSMSAGELDESASAGWVPPLLRGVDRLLRRIERGGLSTLELHRTLTRIRERLAGRR